MAAALKPHGCHASRVWFRVVRQLSVAGMQRRNRNRPFFSFSSPSSIFFFFFFSPLPFCFSFFGTQNTFFSLPFFVVPSLCFRRFIFNVIIIVILFLDGHSPVLRGEPTLEGGVALMLDSRAERKTTRARRGGAQRSRQDGEGDIPRVSPCIILRSFERKQRPPLGALPLLLCLWAPKKVRSTNGIPVTIP